MLQIVPSLAKSGAALRGMRGAGDDWHDWISGAKLADVRIWIHAASVGEAIVAKPVLKLLREQLPQTITAIHTFISPSVAAWSRGIGADRKGYLPGPKRLRTFLQTFRPHIIMYPRADLWPHLVRRAWTQNVPQVVVGGGLSATGRRLRLPARLLLRRVVRKMTAICTVSPTEIKPWTTLGASAEDIRVTGDPRDDDIVENHQGYTIPGALSDWTSGKPVVVAGSVHENDVAPLLTAAAECSSDLRWLLVPHDPGAEIGGFIDRAASELRLRSVVWDRERGRIDADCQVTVVNTRDLLPGLYGLGRLAYIGGGFGPSGVHSAAEAAVWRVPILMGPRASRNRESQRFVDAGGGRIVSGSDEIRVYAERWLGNEIERERAGRDARECLDVGATQRTTDIILSTMSIG